ncbi:MAG: hypothetical protein ACFB0C_02875 [Leptolyngbyaceae cyanobacterium]
MDPAFLIVMVILLFFWTREIFPPSKPPKPSEEAALAKALEKYLDAGIKIRSEK